METRRRAVLGSLGLALIALGGCEEPVPATPSFMTDVRPIFQASCVRCHGSGGTLNADPLAIEKDPPPNGYLDRYDDVGCMKDAAGDLPATCQRGALFEAQTGLIHSYLHLNGGVRMPLAPSDPLASWELSVVDNWVAETPTPLP